MKGIIHNIHERNLLVNKIMLTKVDCAYRYEFTKIADKKTLSQTAYAWLCFTYVADETGNDKNDLYYLCLDKFKTFKEIHYNDQIHLVQISMSSFDKNQMSVFIDKITIFFRQEGFDIPDPEHRKALDMYNYYRKKGLI